MTGKASLRGKALQKKRYDQLKEQGICVSCGKAPATESTIRCSGCLAKKQASDRRQLIRKLGREARQRSINILSQKNGIQNQ